MNTPMGVEVKERATTGHVPQLHPSHIPGAPFPPGSEVSGPLCLHGEKSRLYHHTLVVLEGRNGAIHVASPRCDGARVIALLQAERVCLHVLNVRNDASALPRILLE